MEELASVVTPAFTVYTYDQAGYGASSLPNATMDVLFNIGILEQVADYLVLDQFVLGGISMGGSMDTMDSSIKLRPFCDSDIALFAGWLRMDHVAQWYENPQDWLDEVEKRRGEFAFIRHFIAELNGESIGFCQYYEYCKSGEAWHGSIDIDGAYSIDYLIGDPMHLKKGYGKAIIAELTAKIKEIDGAQHIIVQPDPDNKASCAALLSADYVFDDVNRLYCCRLSE